MQSSATYIKTLMLYYYSSDPFSENSFLSKEEK